VTSAIAPVKAEMWWTGLDGRSPVDNLRESSGAPLPVELSRSIRRYRRTEIERYFRHKSRIGLATIIVTHALTPVPAGTRLRSTMRLGIPLVPHILCRAAAQGVFGADCLDQEIRRLCDVAAASPAPPTAGQVA